MRRMLAAIGVALAVMVVLIFVGRWEGRRNVQRQNARMAAIYALATSNGLVSKQLDRYRLDQAFDCLLYHPVGRPADISAYELCFDANGRLVEAMNREQNPPDFASLQDQPTRATLAVPVPKLLHALAWLGAFRDLRLQGISPHRSTLPVGFNDGGISRFVRRPKPSG